jgi:isopenicillin N synthase-like dioxygenase
VEGGITVNVGDMLSRWSDGRLLSNLHRVRMPEMPPACATEKEEEEDAAAVPARYSLAFFMQADKSAMIECTEHALISAGDYILGRIKSNFTPGTAGAGGK